jgi:hypothetical protein
LDRFGLQALLGPRGCTAAPIGGIVVVVIMVLDVVIVVVAAAGSNLAERESTLPKLKITAAPITTPEHNRHITATAGTKYRQQSRTSGSALDAFSAPGPRSSSMPNG